MARSRMIPHPSPIPHRHTRHAWSGQHCAMPESGTVRTSCYSWHTVQAAAGRTGRGAVWGHHGLPSLPRLAVQQYTGTALTHSLPEAS